MPYGSPRPDLVESSHRARTLDEIFLSSDIFYEEDTPQHTNRASDVTTTERFERQAGPGETRDISAEQTLSTSFDDSFQVDADMESPSNFPIVAEDNRPPPTSPHTKRSLTQRIAHKWKAFVKEALRFKALKLIQIILATIGGILTLLPAAGIRNPVTGLIVDPTSAERTAAGVVLVNGVERAVVAATHFQVICIGLTRMAAFFMYPCKY